MARLSFSFQPENELEAGGRKAATLESEPERTCPNCHRTFPVRVINENLDVCGCGHHFRMSARRRIEYLADEGTFNELFSEVRSADPISFPGYEKKLEATRVSSGEDEAVLCGTAEINGRGCALFVMEPFFLMGSMGTAVGERLALLFEYAKERRLAVIGYSVSGGARMQEGLVSLMQMAKVSGAVKRHADAGLLYISVLTDPTTGGVTASFAMEGDITLAEPGATIGFAGARVIEQTTRKSLPKGFQKAEFLLEHGFVDCIVPRKKQKDMLSVLLGMHEACAGSAAGNGEEGAAQSLKESEERQKSAAESQEEERALTAYDIVRISRSNDRPTSMDYISGVLCDFIQMHGDRLFGDDKAVVGGLARLFGRPVTVIGIEKGRDTKERIARSFGAPNPEGYRKALRLMKQAEKFKRPVICFVDTSGAYCGIGAEERGQGRAIAKNLMEMMTLKTPVISIVVGEGGSGGALALCVSDEVWMLENAIYSVISPEGCASILWKDASKAAAAADVLKLTAEDSLESGLIERIIPEDNIENREEFFAGIRALLAGKFSELCREDTESLTDRRYRRFRRLGQPKGDLPQ